MATTCTNILRLRIRAFAYLSEVVGLSILSDKDVEELQKLWHEQDRESYCFLYEFEVTD